MLFASFPPGPPPSTSIAWGTWPLLRAVMVTAPLFTLGLAGVSRYSVSPTAMAWALGAAAPPELVDVPLELLLPQPAATPRWPVRTGGRRPRCATAQ